MRARNGLVVALVLLVGMAAPAGAEPEKSPMWDAEPLFFSLVLPNPCLGEGFEETWYIDGTAYIREFTTPGGNYHYRDLWWVTASTDSGFTMPERM